MRLRSPLAWVAVAAATIGIAIVPAATAQETTTHTSQFKVTCKTGDLPFVGSQTIAPEKPVEVQVTNPDKVTVGDEFEVTFSIDPVTASLESLPSSVSLERASRLKLDLSRPAGTELVSYKFEGGNLDLSQAQVITVNENGVPDPNGQILRLTDLKNSTIDNSPNTSKSNHTGLGMDLRGKKELTFDFPKVTAKLRATKAGAATLGVRTAGGASSLPNPGNFLSVLATASVPVMGTQWVPAWCAPLDNGTLDTRSLNITTVQIVDKVATPTSTTLTGPAEVTYGDSAQFTAQVSPQAAGKVEFSHGSDKATVAVDANGSATANLTLLDTSDVPVTATFIPADPKSFSTSKAESALKVNAKTTELTLTAPETASTGERIEVTAQLPANTPGQVTFTAAGQTKQVAVNPAGTAKTFFTFAEAADVEIKADFVPTNPQAFVPASATASVQVTKNAATSLSLEGIDSPAAPGAETTIAAVVSPAEGTTDTNGTVSITAGGQTQQVAVVDGRAEAKFTFNATGSVRVNAVYTPAEGSGQTVAKTSGTLTVAEDAGKATITGPTEVVQGTANTYKVAVSPAAPGAITVFVDGHAVITNQQLVDGNAEVELTFPRAEATNRKVRVEFTPTEKSAPTASGELNVTAVPQAISNVNVAFSPEAGTITAGEKNKVQVLVKPDTGQSEKDVFGYITLTNNGKPVTNAAGTPVKVPVAEGVADMDITWLSPKPAIKNLQAKYFGLDDVEYGDATAVFTIADPNAATAPATGDDTVLVGGEGIKELTDITVPPVGATPDASNSDTAADAAEQIGNQATTTNGNGSGSSGSAMGNFWTAFLAFFQTFWSKFLSLFGANK